MQRRRFLAAIGAGSTVALAGCTVFEEIALQVVTIVNNHEAAHTVDARVLLEGEPIHEQTLEVSGDGDAILDCGWPPQRGAFGVGARLAGEAEWVERDLTEPDEDCTEGRIVIDASGESVSVEGDPGCGVPDQTC